MFLFGQPQQAVPQPCILPPKIVRIILNPIIFFRKPLDFFPIAQVLMMGFQAGDIPGHYIDFRAASSTSAK